MIVLVFNPQRATLDFDVLGVHADSHLPEICRYELIILALEICANRPKMVSLLVDVV